MSNKETIQMPVSMRINVLKNGLVTLINTSNLPPYIVEPILKDLHAEVSELADEQARKEAEEYNKAVEENNNNEEPTE